MNGFIVSTFLTFSTLSLAFNYKIYNHPAQINGISCQQKAEEYAELLKKIDGVTVTGVLCESVSKQFNITIRYTSDNELPLLSTYIFAEIYNHRGTYNSKSECLNRLEWEKQTFREETGLEVFLAFCTREKSRHNITWYAQVDGIGLSNRQPRRSSWKSNAFYGISLDELLSEVNESFSHYNFSLKHFTFRERFSLGEITLFFYGPKDDTKFRISWDDVVTIPGLGHCKNQVGNLREQLKHSPSIEPITAYCSSPYSNPSRFDLSLIYKGGPYIKKIVSSETFSNIDTCLLNERRVGDQMRSVYGDTILASICGNLAYDNDGSEGFKVVALRSIPKL